ncbi:class I SAM-dependent methyltransferase [Bacillus sp. PS06]|uniref:class I SAM-dependent methyltransferase n=1 Tax=Bacillus sp. PS06 TaxID=2764176 RepID=UPI001780819A|nr:class I SAM-dependent methyltransferase [Bacillus sp. PS06]MBD8068087.1 class I SAM-dependent methyltransferase [Bacillus sp. PS06]
MIVTTAGRTNQEWADFASQIADELRIEYIVRKKRSVIELQQLFDDDVIVVGKNRLEIHMRNASEPMFFHPNSAMFRAKRIAKGEHDPFLESAGLEKGMKVLDCTLGLGSDSIIASFSVGSEGTIIGLEVNPYIAYVVSKGLQTWESGHEKLDEAMRRVHVVSKDHYSYLLECENDSFDVVYFDPMFEESIDESNGINGLKNLGEKTSITKRVINEARRVAKKRIVLKDHWKSANFQKYGFNVVQRKSAKFHFGTIDLESETKKRS